MIIKKKYAQAHTVSRPKTRAPQETGPARTPEPIEDPYEGIQTPEDFEASRLPDRRRNDRRQGFRRIEDQELISRAHEEANAIREAAAKEGFEEGLNQAQDVVNALEEAIQGLLEAREKALLSAADDLAGMAVEIAERIIKTEVACDEELVLHIVRNTVAKVGREQKSIVIKVNPLDVKIVKDAMKADSGLSESVEVLVTEDAAVDPGSCMVETQAGLIDARFSTQLELLKRMLLTGGKY